MNKMNRS